MTDRDRVRRWLAGLRGAQPPRGLLSPAGAALVWREALDALSDEALDAAWSIPGPGWASVGMAAPRTVPTAPLEWCAVALGRGARFVLKPPAEDPSVGAFLAATAQAAGLPLVLDPDRSALLDPDLAVVMGTDETVAAVRTARGGRAVLGFGHRTSFAWVTDPASAPAVAEDAARFDGRGCLSPALVLTPGDPEALAEALARALAAVEACVPRGDLTPIEGARLRLRTARDRIAGRLREGPGWAVSVVAAAPEEALPRWLPVLSVADAPAALAAVDATHLSTVGADAPFPAPSGARVVPCGRMQRPPLLRRHDGIDWLGALAGARPTPQPAEEA
jgi:hypothetical protein